MDDPGPESSSGVDDPDGWIAWWLHLHPSRLFAGEFARFALDCMSSLEAPLGVGVKTLSFTEDRIVFEVTVEYVLERFDRGIVLHVVSVRSGGDPLPLIGD